MTADVDWGWRDRSHFVMLQAGFATAGHFLATWRAWRADPQRSERLHVIAIEAQPVDGAVPASALGGDELSAQLIEAWPPTTPDLHRLSFDDGRVVLLLAFGSVARWLPEFVASVDRFEVHAGALTDASPRVFKALARLAAPNAVAVVHQDGVAVTSEAGLRQALRTAGFVVDEASSGSVADADADADSAAAALDGSPANALPSVRVAPQAAASVGTLTASLVARYAPTFIPRTSPTRLASEGAHTRRHALIVGAGLAGCATAWALAEQGWSSTVFDRHAAPAQETSGQFAGLFHGIVNPQDGAHARFNRVAALEARRVVAWAVGERGVAGCADGLIRLETGDTDVQAMRHLLSRLMLPNDYVQAVSADTASRLSGLRLNTPAWFYPGGGWVAPSELARALLDEATALQRSRLRGDIEVASLRRHADEWQLIGTDGAVLDQAPVVVWADGGSAFPQAGPPPWTLDRVRGQTTLLAADTPGLVAPRLPVAGMGYVLPAIEGQVMCGATVQTGQMGDTDGSLRHADQRQNLLQLQRLTGSNFDGETVPLAGRVGWRAVAGDRLPVIGG
ncbi:MAG: mnmC, partial [Rhizobacter sp.]|nr:mnmC [Rhizobacter sp.]